MNKIMRENYSIFEMYQRLRNQLLEILNDGDLAYRLPGENKSLGELCLEIGEVQTSYIQSFSTFTQDFSYRSDEPEMAESVSRLSAWYQKLDDELKEKIAAFSDEDLEQKRIDRGPGFVIPIFIQLEVYKEALLIFYGKASTYLHALNKELPEQWQHWIG